MYNKPNKTHNEFTAIEYPKITEADGYSPNHPFRNEKNHEKLLNFIQAAVSRGEQVRNADLRRMCRIDQQVAGWMQLDKEDKQRSHQQDIDGIPKATKQNLPLTYVHLDDMATFLLQTFSPISGMFFHSGDAQEAEPAGQITALMNHQALHAGYHRQISKSLWASLKYNKGYLHVAWDVEFGPRFTPDNSGEVNIEQTEVWAGNVVHHWDSYNTFLDPDVCPSEVCTKGQFAACVEMKSHYWLSDMTLKGEYRNIGDKLNNALRDIRSTTRYVEPPAAARMTHDESTGEKNQHYTDWSSYMKSGTVGSPEYKSSSFEHLTVYARILPSTFGLETAPEADNPQVESQEEVRQPVEQYQLWKFVLIDDDIVAYAERVDNAHGVIPVFSGIINDDEMKASQKSIQEIMSGFQTFASHLMNFHIEASRKALYGLTVYDSSVVDLSAIPAGEQNARIPAKTSARGRDLRQSIVNVGDNVDTESIVSQLQQLFAILDRFFPTQAAPSQIASIDRAVDSQVAAVQQGANRRQQKIAQSLDATQFRPFRHAMFYNILQFQNPSTEITDFRGKQVTIDLSVIRQTDLPFIVGQGLKALDRMAIATKIQQVIFALIQNPRASGEIDLLAMITYWVSMLDIEMDMTQFRKSPEQIAQEQQAAAGGVEETGSGIQPATNPQNVTEPIFG